MNTVPGPPPRGERAGTIDKALQVQPGVWDYPEGGPVPSLPTYVRHGALKELE